MDISEQDNGSKEFGKINPQINQNKNKKHTQGQIVQKETVTLTSVVQYSEQNTLGTLCHHQIWFKIHSFDKVVTKYNEYIKKT